MSRKWTLLPTLLLILVLYPILVRTGDLLAAAKDVTFWMMASVVFMPLSIFFTFTDSNGYKLKFPATHLEKYVSLWLASAVMTLIVLFVFGVLSVLLFCLIGAVFCSLSPLSMIYIIMSGVSGFVAVVLFALLTGVLLWWSVRGSGKREYGVNAILFSSLLFVFILKAYFSGTTGSIYAGTFAGLMSIVFFVWTYFNFKNVQTLNTLVED